MCFATFRDNSWLQLVHTVVSVMNPRCVVAFWWYFGLAATHMPPRELHKLLCVRNVPVCALPYHLPRSDGSVACSCRMATCREIAGRSRSPQREGRGEHGSPQPAMPLEDDIRFTTWEGPGASCSGETTTPGASNLAHCLPPGPCCVEDLHDWCAYGMRTLGQMDATATDLLRSAVQNGIWMTTHYSGVGTAEAAMSQVVDAVQCSSGEGGLVAFSAADVDVGCRSILLAHVPPHAPRHVFGDIMGRVPKPVRDSLARLLQDHKAKAINAGGGLDAIQRFGAKFVREASGLLRRRVKFTRQSRDWCYKHNKLCRCFPTEAELGTLGLHVEVSGSTCVAFSAIGSGWGWLDPSSLPCLVWARMMDDVQPHLLVHENSPRFSVDILRQLIPSLKFRSLTICPTDLGHPVRRLRRYSVGIHTCLVREVRHYTAENMAALFRAVLLDGDVYFSADKHAVRAHREQLAKQRNLPTLAGNEPGWSSFSVLGGGVFRRLREYHDIAHAPGGYLEQHSVCVVNIAQNLRFVGPEFTSMVPALLRRSHLFILRSSGEEREMLPLEHWSAQGWPVPAVLPPGSAAASKFAIDMQALVSLSSASLKSMAGNGMHMGVVGSVLLFLLSSAEMVRELG